MVLENEGYMDVSILTFITIILIQTCYINNNLSIIQILLRAYTGNVFCTVIGGGGMEEERSLFSWNIYSIEEGNEETASKIIVVIAMEKIKKMSIIESDLKNGSGQYKLWGNFCNI